MSDDIYKDFEEQFEKEKLKEFVRFWLSDSEKEARK